MAKEQKTDGKTISDTDATMKRLAQSKRDIEKEIKALRKEKALMASVSKWKEITDLKNSIKELIRDSSAMRGVSMERMLKMQEYYIYQHPTMSKYKTSNKDAEWVVRYVRDKPISVLIDTANKSRPKAWMKMNPKKKKVVSKSASKLPTMNG